MKIDKLILKNMLIVAGIFLVVGCENKLVTDSDQPNTPTKPSEISPEQTQPLPNETKTNSPVPKQSENISHDYCPPCGRG